MANNLQPNKAISNPSKYKRIVVKAGTGVLTDGPESLDISVMGSLVDQVAQLRHEGSEVILVSSGAVAAGRHSLDISREGRDIPSRQVLAAVGQSRLMRTYEELFSQHKIVVAQALLTWNDLSERQSYLNVRNTLMALLELGAVPVLNENDVVAVDEIGEVFGDNDRLSALVANLVDADLLIVLTEVDGLYTADPNQDPNAELVQCVEKVDSSVEALASKNLNPEARGGMATKLQAAKLVTSAGATMVICNGRVKDVLLRLIEGDEIGTVFPPTASRMESRKRWMLSGLSNRGGIVVDRGAELALGKQNRSLLPAGIENIEGEFQRGDIVSIIGPQRNQVGCGIANYSSEDTTRIKGSSSGMIQDILGYYYGEEVVHRSNLVLL